jgi:hypothetical protein
MSEDTYILEEGFINTVERSGEATDELLVLELFDEDAGLVYSLGFTTEALFELVSLVGEWAGEDAPLVGVNDPADLDDEGMDDEGDLAEAGVS